MCLVIAPIEKVDVVCRHEAQSHLVGEIDQPFGSPRTVALVFLYLDEESLGSEDFDVTFSLEASRLFIASGDLSGDLSFQTGGIL